jgi:hypothetical protein
MKYGLNRIKFRLFTQQAEKLGGKIITPSLGSKDQTSQMTFVINIGMLTEYCIPTYIT